MIRPFAFAIWEEVRLLHSHRGWEIGTLCFLMVTFQRDGSCVTQCLTHDRYSVNVELESESIYIRDSNYATT